MRTFELHRLPGGSAAMNISLEGQNLDSVSINNAATSTYLAYRSNIHNSNLGALLVNIERLFPCIADVSNYYPTCHVATHEDDGFRRGKPYIEMADSGNSINIWGETTSVYGLAVQGCPQLSDCFFEWQLISVVCYLPRDACKPCQCNA